MVNYVGQEKFFKWYKQKTGKKKVDEISLLNELFRRYSEEGAEKFVLKPSETVSGKEESYPFRFQNIGCCGASTYYVYL